MPYSPRNRWPAKYPCLKIYNNGTRPSIDTAVLQLYIYPKHIIKLGQPKPARVPNIMAWCAQLRARALAPHGRRAQSGAPSCATRTAVNDSQYVALNCRLKPVRILASIIYS